VFHVLNRAVGRSTLFKKDSDFMAFEKVLDEGLDRLPVRILAYCLMANHWHLVLWPKRDGELSEFMRWVTVTHTQRWHAHHHTSGTGPLYQGRFKAFPVQSDDHLLTVCRYVERNALRANLVRRAEDWRWSSLGRRQRGDASWLADWPTPRPGSWLRIVNEAGTEVEVLALRNCVKRGCPYGNEEWIKATVQDLHLESSLRPVGRPRKKQ
jgi:putative transposase